MRFRTFLENVEQGQALLRQKEAALERALADPRIIATLANLAIRAAENPEADARLQATVEKILSGGNVLEAEESTETQGLASKVATALKASAFGLKAVAGLGKAAGNRLLQTRVVQAVRNAFREFTMEFMMNYSPDRSPTVTALGVIGGMAGSKLKSAYRKFTGKMPPEASLDQYPPLAGE